MLINRNNYESYFLDFLEGNMSSEEEARLMAFLAENPDLEKELHAFENIQLTAESEIFNEKSSLKKDKEALKNINQENFEHFCIAKMEGDLDTDSSAQFDAFISQHPERLKDYKLYLQTFLEPDKNIAFPEKQKLRHRQIKPNRNRILIAASIAASVCLIIISYQFYNTFRNKDQKIYSSIHEKLKIDSLLTANILGPVNKPNTELAQNKPLKSRKITHVEKTDSVKHVITLKAHKPIEIVQLSATSDEITLAPITASLPRVEPITSLENKKSYVSVKEYASNELKKKLDIEDMDLDKDMSVWKAAQTGVKKFNKLTGSRISMVKEYDSVSNRTKVIIHTNLLSFYTSTKK